jgi:HEAT repeat protein
MRRFTVPQSIYSWLCLLALAATVLPGGIAEAGEKKDQLSKDLAALKSNDSSTRTFAAKRLAITPPDDKRRAEVIAALVELMQGTDAFMATHGAHALPVWATPETTPAQTLLNLINHSNEHVRHSAMRVLARAQEKRAVTPIAELLATQRERAEASRSLQEMGPMAEKAVLPYLSQKDRVLQHEACYILKFIGTKESIPALEPLTKSSDAGVALAAKGAIAVIGGREEWVKPNSAVRLPRAGKGDALDKDLAAIRGDESAPRTNALKKLATVKPDPERRAEVVALLVSFMEDVEGFCAMHASRALANWATPETTPADTLMVLMDRSHEQVRQNSMLVLAQLKEKRATDLIAQRLAYDRDRATASKALQKYGPLAEKAVLGMLSHPNKAAQKEACYVLQFVGTKESIPVLEGVAGSGNADLARTAKAAVAAIKSRP